MIQFYSKLQKIPVSVLLFAVGNHTCQVAPNRAPWLAEMSAREAILNVCSSSVRVATVSSGA